MGSKRLSKIAMIDANVPVSPAIRMQINPMTSCSQKRRRLAFRSWSKPPPVAEAAVCAWF
ncbi:MAG: hypothetical protein CM15mP74_34000 [Halieaceae bacterium]|nr:MAG: hypothetical protein CM15mP74_34000 [Halieaceae bacterium]